jgi:glycosyltransferase involved in cell wall biosynthesis
LPHNISERFQGGESREALRGELGAGPEDVVILQASRLERWKGQDVLIRALSLLRNSACWKCWIAGGVQRDSEQAYLKEIQALTGALGLEGRVRFLGERRDVPALMRAADIYSQGNRGPEGFSLAFLEACYCGLPVVTSGIGGALEIVNQDCGILVPPEDTEALAKALQHLIEDTVGRQRMAHAARARAIELCDTQQQLRRLYGLLTGIVGQGGRRC